MNGNLAKVFELTLGKKSQIQTSVSYVHDCVLLLGRCWVCCCWIVFFSPCMDIWGREGNKFNCDQDKKLKITHHTCRQNTSKRSETGQALHFMKSIMFCLIPFFGLP